MLLIVNYKKDDSNLVLSSEYIHYSSKQKERLQKWEVTRPSLGLSFKGSFSKSTCTFFAAPSTHTHQLHSLTHSLKDDPQKIWTGTFFASAGRIWWHWDTIKVKRQAGRKQENNNNNNNLAKLVIHLTTQFNYLNCQSAFQFFKKPKTYSRKKVHKN